MAKTDRNCSVLKLANTFGSDIKVDKNSRMGMAMCTVADILDRFSNTSGNRVYIDPDISRMHAVSATMHTYQSVK